MAGKRTVFILLLLLTGSTLVSQEGFTVVSGRRDDSTFSGRTSLIAFRFRHAASGMFHRNTSGVMPEKRVSFVSVPGKKASFAVYERQGEIAVQIPEEAFYSWSADPGKMDACAKSWAGGRVGASVKQIAALPDSWIFAAMVRHALRLDHELNPFGKNPGVIAMVPSGTIPSLSQILKYPASPGDGACRMIYGEWAWVLYELCRRSGVFQTHDAERFFMALLQDPASDQEELFRQMIFPGIQRRFRSSAAEKKELAMEEWFRKGTLELMLDRTSSGDPGYIETEIRKILKNDGKHSLESLLQAPSPFTPEQLAALNGMGTRIRKLMMISPENVNRALSRFTGSLIRLKLSGPSPDRVKQIREAEEKVTEALQYRTSLMTCLRDAERRHIAPGARCGLLLAAMDENPSIMTPLQIRAGKLLDRYER